MSSVNKVILIGNLGKDPEIRSFSNGDQVANVSLATTDKWKDKLTGEAKEHTEWVNLVFIGRQAEIAGQYLRKGSQIYVEGSIRTRKWQDKEGNDRYTTEVRVGNMQMLGGRPDGSQPAQRQSAPRQQAQQPQSHGGGFDDMADDVPFIDPMKRRVMSFVM